MNPEPYVRNLKKSEIQEWMLEPDPKDERMRHAFFMATLFLDEGNVTIVHDENLVQQVEEATYVDLKALTEKYGENVVEAAKQTARELVGNDNTAEYFEVMLKIFTGNPHLNLHHIRVKFQGREPHLQLGFSPENPYHFGHVA